MVVEGRGSIVLMGLCGLVGGCLRRGHQREDEAALLDGQVVETDDPRLLTPSSSSADRAGALLDGVLEPKIKRHESPSLSTGARAVSRGCEVLSPESGCS